MEPTYTVDEIVATLKTAYNKMDFIDFVTHVLHATPNAKDVWQIEKWELFCDFIRTVVRIPPEAFELILDYGYNPPQKESTWHRFTSPESQ